MGQKVGKSVISNCAIRSHRLVIRSQRIGKLDNPFSRIAIRSLDFNELTIHGNEFFNVRERIAQFDIIIFFWKSLYLKGFLFRNKKKVPPLICRQLQDFECWNSMFSNWTQLSIVTKYQLVLIVTGTVTDVPQTFPHP